MKIRAIIEGIPNGGSSGLKYRSVDIELTKEQAEALITEPYEFVYRLRLMDSDLPPPVSAMVWDRHTSVSVQ